MVMVTATIPATGARRGDQVDCYVSAINGKSLVGGRLAFASLLGPNTQRHARLRACAKGRSSIDNPEQPTVGVVHGGCQMEADIFTPFYSEDGFITLILDRNHANFQTAALIAEDDQQPVPREPQLLGTSQRPSRKKTVCHARSTRRTSSSAFPRCIATIRSASPPTCSTSSSTSTSRKSRVVINPRAGSIVISGDVEIGDVVVSHKNIVVEAVPHRSLHRRSTSTKRTIRSSSSWSTSSTRSRCRRVDMIEIIRGIDRNGKLHGRLIIE